MIVCQGQFLLEYCKSIYFREQLIFAKFASNTHTRILISTKNSSTCYREGPHHDKTLCHRSRCPIHLFFDPQIVTNFSPFQQLLNILSPQNYSPRDRCQNKQTFNAIEVAHTSLTYYNQQQLRDNYTTRTAKCQHCLFSCRVSSNNALVAGGRQSCTHGPAHSRSA